MAKAIFAGKKVKELSFNGSFGFMALLNAIFTWFFKYFLVRNRPSHASYGDSQYKQVDDLCKQLCFVINI